jgi:uncharacterized RDD family membrane protein YckC
MPTSGVSEDYFGEGPGLASSGSSPLTEATSDSDTAWRSEVATRVHSYRARRGEEAGDGALPSPPCTEQSYPVPSITECAPAWEEESPQEEPGMRPGELSPHTMARLEEIRNAAHSAFDTNYYRRLNLETLSAMAEETAAKAAQLAIDLDLRPVPDGDSSLDRYCIAAPEASGQAAEAGWEPMPCSPDAPETADSAPPEQGNLIVFPRPLLEPPLMQQPERDELAEPVRRRPRILEVPEDIMPAVQGSLFPEIRLDGDDSEADAGESELQVPMPVAPFARRLQAAVLDAVVIASAGALFTAIAWRALPDISHSKPFWTAMAAVSVLLWALYQQLFLLCAGRTFGMRQRGIRLTSFDGHVPHWRQRRSRALFLLISTATGMLGNLWALLDNNALCWHDRLSQTFPTLEPPE